MFQVLRQRDVTSVHKVITKRGDFIFMNGSRQSAKTFDLVQEIMRTFTSNSHSRIMVVHICKQLPGHIESELRLRKLESSFKNIKFLTHEQYFNTQVVTTESDTDRTKDRYDATFYDDMDLFMEKYVLKAGRETCVVALNLYDN